MTCQSCGSDALAANQNAGDWDWPYRCFICQPPKDDAEYQRLPNWLKTEIQWHKGYEARQIERERQRSRNLRMAFICTTVALLILVPLAVFT